MPVSSAAILAVILAHPSWTDREVSSEQREVALAPLAVAIAEASRDRAEASRLLSLARHESGFAIGVVHGFCERGECDGSAARGAFQLHASACPAAWALPAGSDESLKAEAKCALALLYFHGKRCREHAITPDVGGYAGFATGSRCAWSGAEARVRTARKMAAELSRAEGN